jgi:hypothetical protein
MTRCLAGTLVLLFCTTAALSQSEATKTAPAQKPPDPPPVVITIRPAAEPVPALKYRFAPERRSLIRGNAALFYHRAILFVHEEDNSARRSLPEKTDTAPKPLTPNQKLGNWAALPIGELPREEARAALEHFGQAVKEVELGARRTTCDWEFDQRTEGIQLLLSEIQEVRQLARILAVKIRLAILDGKTDEALHWIDVGMTMGRHVAHGPTLIQALIGIAIDSVMAQCLIDLTQAPGAPNLYWALADRPRPFIDPRYPFEGERYLLEKELPELNELDSHVWSVDEARHFADELQRKLFALASETEYPSSDSHDLTSTVRRLGIAAIAAKIYPEAKEALIAQGWSADRVEAMPVIQVAALHTILEYQKLRDNTYKWLNQPNAQSFDKVDQAFKATMSDRMKNPLLTMFSMLMPAISSARFAFVRLERQLDAIQTIEAIRLYANSHAGALPPNLAAITDVPIPLDPATGNPFDYQLQGDSATLSAPSPPGMSDVPALRLHYLLKLAK